MHETLASREVYVSLARWHWALVVAGGVTFVTACAHAPVEPAELRPVGLTCGVSNVRADRPADRVFKSARSAFAAMHIVPLSDSAEGHLLVSGANAPHGKGSAEMQKARMYLDFRVVAAKANGDSTVSTYSVAPGLSVQPSGLSVDDGWKLYRQADEFAAEFMARAGLPWGSCFGVKG